MTFSDFLVTVHVQISYDSCLIPTSPAPQGCASCFCLCYLC